MFLEKHIKKHTHFVQQLRQNTKNKASQEQETLEGNIAYLSTVQQKRASVKP